VASKTEEKDGRVERRTKLLGYKEMGSIRSGGILVFISDLF
jgi:hypothetical protein